MRILTYPHPIQPVTYTPVPVRIPLQSWKWCAPISIAAASSFLYSSAVAPAVAAVEDIAASNSFPVCTLYAPTAAIAVPAAAIVAALVSLTCVPVLGYPGVFQMIFAYWTDDYYTFGSHDAPGSQAVVGQPAEVPQWICEFV